MGRNSLVFGQSCRWLLPDRVAASSSTMCHNRNQKVTPTIKPSRQFSLLPHPSTRIPSLLLNSIAHCLLQPSLPLCSHRQSLTSLTAILQDVTPQSQPPTPTGTPSGHTDHVISQAIFTLPPLLQFPSPSLIFTCCSWPPLFSLSPSKGVCVDPSGTPCCVPSCGPSLPPSSPRTSPFPSVNY